MTGAPKRPVRSSAFGVRRWGTRRGSGRDGTAERPNAEPTPNADRRTPNLAAVTLAILALAAAGAAAASPDPGGIATNLWTGFTTGAYLKALAWSAARIAAGFAIAAVLGSVLGLAQAGVPLVRRLCGPLTTGVQALPAVCWLPVALLWFGRGEAAILFVVVVGSVFAIALGVRDGLAQLPPLFRRVGQTFGLTRWQQIRRITLPGALPGILAGLKQGWSFGWRALMAGELIYAGSGLGRSLTAGREAGDTNQVFAVMLLILFLGVAVDRLGFGIVEKRVLAKRGLG